MKSIVFSLILSVLSGSSLAIATEPIKIKVPKSGTFYCTPFGYVDTEPNDLYGTANALAVNVKYRCNTEKPFEIFSSTAVASGMPVTICCTSP